MTLCISCCSNQEGLKGEFVKKCKFLKIAIITIVIVQS